MYAWRSIFIVQFYEDLGEEMLWLGYLSTESDDGMESGNPESESRLDKDQQSGG